jgi:hypothetical protein
MAKQLYPPGAGARGRFSLSSAACEPFRFSSSLSNATRECTAAPATVLTPLRLGGFGVGPRKDELPAVRFSEAVTSFRDALALARGSLALKLVR